MGRADELRQLHTLLQQSDRVAIAAATGMGGIGKTELAWQYAQRHRAEYPGGIWWIRQPDRVLQMLSYALQMGFPEVPDALKSDRERVQWVYDRWLKALPEGARLLVLDDVLEYGEVRSLLPQDDRFRVLLTTRQQFGKPVQRLDLGVLKPAAAFRLLRRLVEDDHRIRAEVGAARALCDWVGRLPLGIELIGRHLASRSQLKLATLLQRLEAQKLQSAALRHVPAEMPYQDNLEAAFELSWQLLNQDARTLGALLSGFALAPINREWVVACLADWDEERLEDAETALVQSSLLAIATKHHSGSQLHPPHPTRSTERSRRSPHTVRLRSAHDEAPHPIHTSPTRELLYLLHTLIREFLVAKLAGELAASAEPLRRQIAQVLTAIAKTVPQTVTQTDLARVQGAIPHLSVVASTSTNLLDDADAIWPFTALGRVAEGQSHWQAAEDWWKSCLEMAEQCFGASHPDTALSLNNLAGLYYTTGRYEEAEPLFRRALDIREQQLCADHPDIALSLNNLALLYRTTGRYEEAEPLYKRTFDIREQQLGADHPDTATSLNNLAELYRTTGRYEQAESLYRRALDIWKQQLGADHPYTATTLNNLAALYRTIGRYGEAEPLFRRALSIREQQFGADHSDTATSLNNLATLYETTERYGEAEPLYRRALDICEQQLGADHPHTQTVWLNFWSLVQQAVESGRVEELSDHPLTQSVLRALQGEGNPTEE